MGNEKWRRYEVLSSETRKSDSTKDDLFFGRKAVIQRRLRGDNKKTSAKKSLQKREENQNSFNIKLTSLTLYYINYRNRSLGAN